MGQGERQSPVRVALHKVKQHGHLMRGSGERRDCLRDQMLLRLRSSEVIRGHQRSSEVIRGHQRSSEVIVFEIKCFLACGHQRSSEVIRGHQRSSEVIRGHLACQILSSRSRALVHLGISKRASSVRSSDAHEDQILSMGWPS